MSRSLGLFALVALVLAALLFLVAAADITVSDLTTTRKLAWGFFCLTVAFLLWGSGALYGPRVP